MSNNRGGKPRDLEHSQPQPRQEKAGQQPRPNHIRPERPTTPPPPPPTSEGKTD